MGVSEFFEGGFFLILWKVVGVEVGFLEVESGCISENKTFEQKLRGLIEEKSEKEVAKNLYLKKFRLKN